MQDSNNAITHENLLSLGFELLGMEDNDPYYRYTIDSDPSNFKVFAFAVYNLTGRIEEGYFVMYNNNKKYYDISKLKMVIDFFLEQNDPSK